MTNLNKYAAQILALVAAGYGLCGSAHAQVPAPTASLHTIIETYYQRLETTYAYQPVALLRGTHAVRRYLRIKNKKYLLEYVIQDENQQLQESFFFKRINKDTLLVSKEKYLFNSQNINSRVEPAIEIFTRYLDEGRLEAGNVLIRQRFNPLADLGKVTGLALYATDINYQTLGDTIACYFVQPPTVEQPAYRIELHERRQPAKRRWSTSQLSQTWLIDAPTRQITSMRPLTTTSGAMTWVRTYTNATDFSETLIRAYSPRVGVGIMAKDVVYQREFRQRSAFEAVDSYLVPNSGPNGISTLFEIVYEYE